jgi:cell fate regulator YaaT (PSP1 superfamily)
MSNDIVEVKFKGERTVLYRNPEQLTLNYGDFVIVEANKGVDLGRVNHIGDETLIPEEAQEIKSVVRKSNFNDLTKLEVNHYEEEKALKTCKEKVKNHGLDMKVIDCEYQFDRNRVTFYFTSDNRVDFRQLVRDLASVFKTRIELRQISPRDEAKRLSGFGVCGRQLCCSCWLKEFLPVTTQAARDQNLALNPSKLAGVCGRLKCCLMYERDFYNEAIKQFPTLAKPIVTEKGEGIVASIDILSQKVVIQYPDETFETVSLEYVQNIYACSNQCSPVEESWEDLN